MAPKQNDREARQARERLRAYQARQTVHEHKVKRRKRDNWVAGIAAVVIVALAVGTQLLYFSAGPGAAKASSSDEVREMKKSLDALRASIDSIKTQTNGSIAQLGAKVERLQREQAKLQKPNERVSRNEHVDSATTTGSIAHVTASHVKVASAQTNTASSKSHPAATAAVQPKKAPKLLVDWVVRDVYRGVALIEGPQGTFEVARGDPIPGAGTVESIERKNGGWVLVTSRGIVGSVRD